MIDDFGKQFLTLLLHVDRHVDGFVDAYYGPPDIREAVLNGEPMPIEVLQASLSELRTDLPSDDPQRAKYLDKMITAAQTALRLGRDETLTFEDEARLLFDIEPEKVDEKRFKKAIELLESALPGSGDLQERRQAFRDHYTVPPDKIETALQLCLTEARRRTTELIELVPSESVDITLVTDKSWDAYNWFKGNAKSLIEFNVDFPANAIYVINMIAHEGYPGHHTESILKEKYLYQDRGYAEFAISPLYSPDGVIAEAIATTAYEIIFPDDTGHQWMDEHLFPEIDLEPHPVEVREAVKQTRHDLRYCVGRNAALLYHTNQLSESETLEYLREYALVDEKRAQHVLSFIKAYRTYAVTYSTGYDLIEKASRGDKLPLFKRLLTEPLMPSDLASMI